MRNNYASVCTSEYLYREAHTVKTIKNEIFVNMWNGEFVSRTNPQNKMAVSDIYLITKNVTKNLTIVASRTDLKYPLRFLIKSKPINKK